MLTSIIEPGNFMVGTKIFKSGDVIELTPEEQTEMDAVCAIFSAWNDVRTDLLNECHLSKDAFNLDLAAKAHDMKIQNFHLRYRLNLLIAAVEKRVGGLLPIFFSSTQKNLFISDKAEESLVYTTKFIGDTIGMAAYDFPRTVMTALMGKERTYFDNARDEILSCISVFGDVPEDLIKTYEEATSKESLEMLTKGIESALVADGPTAMSLVVLWGKTHARIINADAIPSTVDPNTRVLWNLKKILAEEKCHAISLVIEKAEPTKISFVVSHLVKDEAAIGAHIVHTLGPVRETETTFDTAPTFAITRMTPEAINDLLI